MLKKTMKNKLQNLSNDSRRGPLAWFAANHVAANLLMIVVIVAGALGSTRVRQEVVPEFELDIVTA